MRLVLALILLSWNAAAQSAAPADSPKLYQYQLYVSGGDKPIQPKLDLYPERMIDFMTHVGLLESCVDMKRDFNPEKGYVAVVRVLLNAPIEKEHIQLMVDYLCNGKKGCRVQGWDFVQDLNNLEFLYIWSQSPYLDSPSKNKKKTAAFGGAPLAKFPRFSSSCEDGSTGDSYLQTARSNESRALIANSGIRLENIKTIGLRTKNDKKPWWGFGLPDLHWNDRPVTKHNQPLAPKEILEELE